MRKSFTILKAALPLAGVFALAACQAEEPTMEADAEDLSGGELITVPEDAEGIEVDLPETEMTMVPVEEGMEAAAEDAPAE